MNIRIVIMSMSYSEGDFIPKMGVATARATSIEDAENYLTDNNYVRLDKKLIKRYESGPDNTIDIWKRIIKIGKTTIIREAIIDA